MKAPKKTFFLVSKGSADDAGVPVVLDLLRYDGAQAEGTVGDPDDESFRYYLVSTTSVAGLEKRRWRAHGVEVVSENFYDRHEAEQFARRVAAVGRVR